MIFNFLDKSRNIQNSVIFSLTSVSQGYYCKHERILHNFVSQTESVFAALHYIIKTFLKVSETDLTHQVENIDIC